MSARDDVHKALRELYVSHQGATAPWDLGCDYCGQRMEKIMAAVDVFAKKHAHELAEKIRKQRHESHDHISCIARFIYGEAAALVDPEVLNGE